ncbi:MAG: hypothetical protein ACLGH3_06640, partial [Actinomycetota bacterium]
MGSPAQLLARSAARLPSCSPVNRVLVLGGTGAGKSTFARRLGVATGLPVVHLDLLWWRPGWIESPRAEFDAAVAAV